MRHDSGDHTSNSQLPSIVWFESLLESRFRNAGYVSALLGLLFFIPLVIFIQSSVYHPIQTLTNVLYLILSLKFLFSALSILILGFFLTRFYIRNCFNPFYETNFNVKKYQVGAATVAMSVSFATVWFLAFYASVTPVYLSWTVITYFVLVAFFTSWQTALGANFRWQCTEIGLFTHLSQVGMLIFWECAYDLPRNIVRGLIVTVPLALLHSNIRPSFFDLILAPSTMLSSTVLIYFVQAYTRLVFEIINVTTMQPISLPLVGQFEGTAKQQRQQQSLISAITSDNDLLRLFGFRALHDAAVTSLNTRQPIYSLSQPGKNPRTWIAVYETCSRVLEMVREQLQTGTSLMETDLGERKTLSARPELSTTMGDGAVIGVRHRNVAEAGLNLRPVNTPTIPPTARRRFNVTEINSPDANGSGSKSNSLDGNLSGDKADGQSSSPVPHYHPKNYLLSKTSKIRLLQPPHLNARYHGSSLHVSKPWINLRAFPGYHHVQNFVDQVHATFLKPAPTVSSYLLTLSEYSLHTLSLLTTYSIHEDRYGIVQEKIGQIFGMFIRLELAIDLYIRSTSNNKTEQAFRPNLHQMEDVLVSSLLAVYSTFRPYVDTLEMTDAERKMLKVLVNVDNQPT
ncbi:Nucleoporin protein Ndc1-Nup [Aphelenchoides besseyi]|nr:Nucleoporin protein Ndc1-Nup [Aphelenchoides besseyi]